MKIGIIGGDDRAVAIGRLLRRAGHAISFSDPTAKDAALHATQALGGAIPVTTAAEQAAHCEALVLAIHWEDLELAIEPIGRYSGLVIDATRPPRLGGFSGAELLSRRLSNPRVVKAFVDNVEPGRPIRIASDDADARNRMVETIHAGGETPEDYGPLEYAIEIERSYRAAVPMHLASSV